MRLVEVAVVVAAVDILPRCFLARGRGEKKKLLLNSSGTL
jgi:hypothetical protein